VRDDLLDARACIDWTLAQFPILEERVNSWLKLNVVVEVEDAGPSNVLVAVQREELPRSFNVEIGAYLNTVRSSLDILASTLATRYGICAPEDAYFPITKSETAFRVPGSRSATFFLGLPPAERSRLEALKPYQGGNDDLWSLHRLDIMRKHRRLLTVIAEPDFFSVEGPGIHRYFTPPSIGFMRAGNASERKVVLGLMAKDAPPYGMKFCTVCCVRRGRDHRPEAGCTSAPRLCGARVLDHQAIRLIQMLNPDHRFPVI
jgi:hypothetical protein